MKKDDLNKLKNLHEECERLKKQIDKIENEMSWASDVVQGSSKNFPYNKHMIQIQGLTSDIFTANDIYDNREKLNRLKKYLEDKKSKYIDTIFEFNNYIVTNIEDPINREIFRYRHIDGLTFSQIAFKIGGGNDKECIKKRYQRQFKKL